MNLDAELELERSDYNPSARVTAQLARYAEAARALLGPCDAQLSELAHGRAQESHGFIGRAWCPTPRALAALRAAGIAAEPHPALSVLRRVNHRRFAHELGGGLDEQRYVQTRDELTALVRDSPRPWLLKRPLAYAGRGQLRVFAWTRITPPEHSWIDASLERDGLIVEPLVAPLLELSLHGFVWLGGDFELGRACVQSVSERGVFRGVRLAAPGELDPSEHAAFMDAATRTASALAQAGYFGPFGIDGYRYADAHAERVGFCALSEINARYTMGFATGFPRHPSTLHLDGPGSQ